MQLAHELYCANLKLFRHENELTQEQLSSRCGYDSSYVGKIERGEKFPSFPASWKLSSELHQPVGEFFKINTRGCYEIVQRYFFSRRNTSTDQDVSFGKFANLFQWESSFMLLVDRKGRVKDAVGDTAVCCGTWSNHIDDHIFEVLNVVGFDAGRRDVIEELSKIFTPNSETARVPCALRLPLREPEESDLQAIFLKTSTENNRRYLTSFSLESVTG